MTRHYGLAELINLFAILLRPVTEAYRTEFGRTPTQPETPAPTQPAVADPVPVQVATELDPVPVQVVDPVPVPVVQVDNTATTPACLNPSLAEGVSTATEYTGNNFINKSTRISLPILRSPISLPILTLLPAPLANDLSRPAQKPVKQRSGRMGQSRKPKSLVMASAAQSTRQPVQQVVFSVGDTVTGSSVTGVVVKTFKNGKVAVRPSGGGRLVNVPANQLRQLLAWVG